MRVLSFLESGSSSIISHSTLYGLEKVVRELAKAFG
jgi:hypothetical protein